MKSVEYTYPRSKVLFQNLNLMLGSGAVCGLLGKNGAGKTTLLKLMTGLLFPKTGDVRVMGHQPKARTVEYLQNLYFLPDTFKLPAISMKQYLACYSVFYPMFDVDVYNTAIEAFELEPTKRLTDLSLGQQKKFLLAFGFATGAKLMVFDEPTNALDIPSKQQLRKLLAEHAHASRAFVISTHQIKDIEYLIDEVVILDEGQIIFNQSYESIQDNMKAGEASVDLELLFNTVLSKTKS
ncbi:MAG: ABC transporter ATP-binding protein [Legionellaceae bacterium]|nr:ABC transporter ATP-binding protein [Legionellaceae bacterium]